MFCFGLNPEHAKDKVTNHIVDEKSNECFVNIFTQLFHAFFNPMQVMQKYTNKKVIVTVCLSSN